MHAQRPGRVCNCQQCIRLCCTMQSCLGTCFPLCQSSLSNYPHQEHSASPAHQHLQGQPQKEHQSGRWLATPVLVSSTSSTSASQTTAAHLVVVLLMASLLTQLDSRCSQSADSAEQSEPLLQRYIPSTVGPQAGLHGFTWVALCKPGRPFSAESSLAAFTPHLHSKVGLYNPTACVNPAVTFRGLLVVAV